MAESEERPAELDLHARIQARIDERRSGATSPSALTVAQLRATHLATVPAADGVDVPPESSPTEVTSGGGRHSGPRQTVAVRPPGAGRGPRWLIQLVVLVLVTALAVIGLRGFVVASYYIPSASMETTLHGCPTCEPDLVLVDKLSYRFKSISRTDVVVFSRPPLAPPEDKQLIKRVIGLPGETVSGHDGHVYIGSRELIEPYIDKACAGTADFAPITVPAGEYFMMGDNRCDSLDSRVFGPIPRSTVIGRAFAIMWPVKRLHWL